MYRSSVIHDIASFCHLPFTEQIDHFISKGISVTIMPTERDFIRQRLKETFVTFNFPTQAYKVGVNGSLTVAHGVLRIYFVDPSSAPDDDYASDGGAEIYLRCEYIYFPVIKGYTSLEKFDPCNENDHNMVIGTLSHVDGGPNGDLTDVFVLCFRSDEEYEGFSKAFMEHCGAKYYVTEAVRDAMVYGSAGIASGLVKVSQYIAGAVQNATPYVIEKMGPEASEGPEVDPVVARRFETAQEVSSKTASYTGQFASYMIGAFSSVGTFVAPHAEKMGVKLLEGAGLSSEQASNTYSGAMNIASGAVQGVRNIFNAVDESSRVVASSVASSTVQIVKHNYGPEVGNITENGLSTAGNVYVAAQHVKVLTPSGIVKKSLKETGKAICQKNSNT